jgi:hypothetical protein
MKRASRWEFRPSVRLAAAVVAALALTHEAAGQGRPVQSQSVQDLADRAAAGTWDTCTLHIAVRHYLVAADGQPTGPAPMVQELVWERTRAGARGPGGGWTTTMRLVSTTAPVVRSRLGAATLPALPTVARIEDAEDGTPPRFFDRAGTQVAPPSESLRNRARQALTSVAGGRVVASLDPAVVERAVALPVPPAAAGREWIASLVMPTSSRAQRLEAFQRQFGPSTGTVRGLTQFARRGPDGRREVLVDGQSGVPIESNVVVDDTLVTHSTFAYEAAASGVLLRRGARIERVLNRAAGASDITATAAPAAARVVTEVTFRDVRLDQKGGR